MTLVLSIVVAMLNVTAMRGETAAVVPGLTPVRTGTARFCSQVDPSRDLEAFARSGLDDFGDLSGVRFTDGRRTPDGGGSLWFACTIDGRPYHGMAICRPLDATASGHNGHISLAVVPHGSGEAIVRLPTLASRSDRR